MKCLPFNILVLDCGPPPSVNNTHSTLLNGTVYSSLVMYNCTGDHHVFTDSDTSITETYTMCTKHGNWSQIVYPEGCHCKYKQKKHCIIIDP